MVTGQPLRLLLVVLLHLNVITFNVFVFGCGVREEKKSGEKIGYCGKIY